MNALRRTAAVVGMCLAAGVAWAQAEQKQPAAGGAEVGKSAPEFTLKDSSGKSVSLSEFKDKLVVLEWFNYDCPYCKKVAPKAKELAAKYKEKGVVWLAVDSTHFRKAEENQKHATENKLPYPILMDSDGKVGKAYGAKTTPHVFILSKGTVAYNGAFDNEGDRNYVSESLDALLAGKPVPVTSTKPYGCSVKYKP